MRTKSIREGSSGANVTEAKYTPVRKAILAALPRNKSEAITWDELCRRVAKQVEKTLFPKGVQWYTKTVQLDLEAKGLVRRLSGVSPQRLYRVK